MGDVTKPAASTAAGFLGALRAALPLLIGLAFLLVGSGLTATLIGVRGGIEGFRPGVIGLVLSGYYLGYVGGSYLTPPAIVRVGHIRVFAGLAGLASAAILVHLILVDPISWFVLRLIVGLAVSGLYVVCETWLNGLTTNRSRGKLFAVYMIVVSASLLGGQFVYAIVGAHGFEPFVIAAVLVSLAVVPVSFAIFPSVAAPQPRPIAVRTIFRVAPLAVVGTSMSGFIGAAMLSAGVVYASQAGFNRSATGAFVGAALAGGVALQLPLGAWSDRVDRRFVLALTALAGLAVALVASQVPTDRRLVLIACMLVAGGAAFPIYSLSVAHLNDYVDDDLKVAAGSKMVLVNGIGAVAGPIVGSIAIGRTSPGGLFVVVAVAYLVVGVDSLYRMTRRSAAEEEARARFVPVVVGVGPTGVMGADEEEADRFPVVESETPDGNGFVRFTERGSGPVIVLVGDAVVGDAAVGDAAGWEPLAGALATDGFRVVIPALDRVDDPVDDPPGALGALLGGLGVRSATFVGAGIGVGIVERLAVAAVDRVDALVLVGDGDRSGSGEARATAYVPTLLSEESRLSVTPLDLADDIAEFVRPIAASMSVRLETGRIEVVPGEDE